MRISYQWLSEYLDLPPVEEVARQLTAVGLEVEGIERGGQGLEGVVAARILSSVEHPDAAKLSVARVDAGSGEPLQIVCGAKNYAVGDVVPLATVGTTLPNGQRIERAKLRGIVSSGMLCSAKELGLDDDASGLLLLPRDVAPGTPIARALGLDDAILEVNVTPNRPDALSHLGIAREIGAALGREAHLPARPLVEGGSPAGDAVRVRIEAPQACHRYAARVVEGVRIGPSPGWLARRLERCGIRSISNVVDATNFVLLELGHPLHAFDLDRVAGREIVVRLARPGERMTTLDREERALDPGDLVIADRERASALAGVMGGGDSEISPGTTRVLVESAWFAPAGIRRTARRHGLKTEASYRFERGADPEMVLPAAERCAQLVAELAGGIVRAGAVDAVAIPWKPVQVRLRWSRPSRLLGLAVRREETQRILGSLGFAERDATEEGASFRVPSFRQDVTREEDLVEEIVRSKGFDAIPETLPRLVVGTPAAPPELEVVRRLREALESSGLCEAVSFSFVAPADLAAFDPAVRPLLLRNPISAELSAMRTSVLPSLLRLTGGNLRRRSEDVRLYEIARSYAPALEGAELPAVERTQVAGVLLGRRSPVGWATPGDRLDLYDGKEAVGRALSALGIEGERWIPAAPTWAHPRFAARIDDRDGAPLGEMGELHPRVAAAFELPRGVLAFALDLEALLRAARLVPRYAEVPRFPAVLRDLAVVVPEGVPAASVLALVRAEPLVEDATLFDVYAGAPIPQGRKNLALALRYRSAERTLTDAEVDAAHARILERLCTDPAVAAELRV